MNALPSLHTILTAYGLRADKNLGQHFLLDEQLTQRIASYAGDLTGCDVIEIGPGPGGLTRALLDCGAQHVYAVEKDARCIALLNDLAEHSKGRLTVIQADALKTDVTMLCDGPRKIVANLPYNIGTALLIGWLEAIHAQGPSAFSSLTLMFQQEVADRILAVPRTKDYGRLSVLAQWLTSVTPNCIVPPEAFTPPPKIMSSVITLTPRAKPLVDAPKEALEAVLAAGFNQRRKMLRVSLKSLNVDVTQLLEQSGIDGTRRAEELSVEEWCGVAKAYGLR